MGITLLPIFALAVACGSDSVSPAAPPDAAGAESGSAVSGDVQSEPVVVRSDDIFTLDSFTSAGWKKSKQYSPDTVPGATDVWYGFYNQKDIEIRFYPDHQTALSNGAASAEESIESAVKRSRGGRLLDVSGGSFSGYGDYVIAGNAILLCEFEISTCEALLAQVK